jgi:hypothetical protein
VIIACLDIGGKTMGSASAILNMGLILCEKQKYL